MRQMMTILFLLLSIAISLWIIRLAFPDLPKERQSHGHQPH